MFHILECGPMPNLMVALPNIGGALCSTPQSLADAHYQMMCSNAAKMQNPLKYVGVPQTPERSQPLVGRSSPYYQEMQRRYCCLASFFSDCRYMPQLRRYGPTKLCDGAKMAIFCVLYFQRAVCDTFQTCILNLHQGHTMCQSMVNIQSPTAEIRRGKKRRKKKKQDENIKVCPITQGDHNQFRWWRLGCR